MNSNLSLLFCLPFLIFFFLFVSFHLPFFLKWLLRREESGQIVMNPSNRLSSNVSEQYGSFWWIGRIFASSSVLMAGRVETGSCRGKAALLSIRGPPCHVIWTHSSHTWEICSGWWHFVRDQRWGWAHVMLCFIFSSIPFGYLYHWNIIATAEVECLLQTMSSQ